MNPFAHKASKATGNNLSLYRKPTSFTIHRNNCLAQRQDKSDSGTIATVQTFWCHCYCSNILIIKPTRCTNFLNLFFRIELHTFRTVSLSIIRSLILYTQQQVYVIQVLLTACQGNQDGTAPDPASKRSAKPV